MAFSSCNCECAFSHLLTSSLENFNKLQALAVVQRAASAFGRAGSGLNLSESNHSLSTHTPLQGHFTPNPDPTPSLLFLSVCIHQVERTFP